MTKWNAEEMKADLRARDRERERRINRALGVLAQLTLLRATHTDDLGKLFASRAPLASSPTWRRYRSLIRREVIVLHWMRAQLNPIAGIEARRDLCHG